MKTRILPFALALFITSACFSQVWEPKAAGALPSNFEISDISIVSEQVIWATAIDYSQATSPVPATHIIKLLKSTDSGVTWEVKDIEEATGRVSWDIHAFDENTACITTQNLGPAGGRGIFRTTNGGETWTETLNHGAGGVWVHFFDAQEGICINRHNMARTLNGGETWSLVSAANIPAFMSGEGTEFTSASNALGTFENSLWFGTTKGRIFKSEDRGQNWAVSDTGLGVNSNLSSLGFIDEKNGLAISYMANDTTYETVRTVNGGISWEQTDNFDFVEVDAIPCSKTFMGTAFYIGQRTSLSTNMGETWAEVDTSIDAGAAVFLTPELGWMWSSSTGAGPAIYKWIGGPLTGRTFVNKNANGANDGATWADAYTDLKVALDSTEAGDEIWVAEGTYFPGSDPTATFLIDKNLKLYGGFAGTECNLSERDIEMYPTILSGDLDDNDVPDDFVTNRADNVMTVMTINSNISNETVIDGFIISNGHADGVTNNQQQNGAGIYSLGAPKIKNCQFDQSYALLSGGGLLFSQGSSNGAIVEKCRFNKNRADNEFNGGGGLYVGFVAGEGISVLNCEFTGNEGGRGSGLAGFNSSLKVTNSLFSGNTNIRQGGGLWFWGENPAVTLDVDSCIFENNHSSFGGGLYSYLGSNSGVNINHSTFNGNMVTPNILGWGQGGGGIIMVMAEATNKANIVIENCLFDQNTTSASGGGVSIYNDGIDNSLLIRNCDFTHNESIYHGGGFLVNANATSNQTKIVVDSCSFSENTVEMWTGSGFRALLLGGNVDLTLSNSSFTQNTTGLAGAAGIYGFEVNSSGQVNVDQCLFQNNISDFDAGLSIGSGTKAGFFEHTITGCNFLNNSSIFDAGGLDTYSEVPARFLVEDCLFDGNSAGGTAGGFYIANTNPDVESTIRNCIWKNNESPKGAAIGSLPFVEEIEDFATTMDASFTFENCLIYNNIGDTAAIALKQTGNVKFLNCTVANNSAGGLALDSLSAVTMQNTIFYNPGYVEFTDLTGTSTATSLGGNLLSDNSLAAHALTYDHQEVADPGFVSGGDYHLHSTSFAIDKGVDLGDGSLPATDIDGDERPYMGGCVDIGMDETQVIVSSDCLTDSREALIGEISLSPNPASDLLYLALPDNAAPTGLAVFDAQGRLVLSQKFAAGDALRVGHLPDGVFMVKVTDGERVFAGKFIKQ